MRSARFGLLSLLLWVVPAWSQQAPQPTQPLTGPLPVTTDTRALTVLTQALDAAGGIPVITAITDYTATGNITYRSPQDKQGSVTIRGAGLDHLRMDAYLGNGVRSQITSPGVMKLRSEDGKVSQVSRQTPVAPPHIILPYVLLAQVLHSPAYSLTFKGIVQVDGVSTYDIQIQRVFPAMAGRTLPDPDYNTVQFFFDVSTFQVLMVQEVVPNHLVFQHRYSNYQLVNGVRVPFSVDEQISGQQTWTVRIDQFGFNSGLQDSDFDL